MKREHGGRKAQLLRWLGHTEVEWGHDPGQLDLSQLERTAEWMGKLYGQKGWFDLTVKGWEHLPPAPGLFVSNHSGGTTIPDVWGLLYAWVSRHGTSRIVHPLAHDMIFAHPKLGELAAKVGVLRANPRNGRRVLEEWRRDLFVCPGGDKDTWRPWKDRYKVRFSGRRGYAKLALITGTPVVPVANAGAHETLVVLTDGARIARTLRFPQLFRAEVFPVHLSVPWGLAVGPWPHLPMPAHLRYQIGPAISVGAPQEDPSEKDIEELDSAVQTAIQKCLDQLRAEHPDVGERARRVYRVARRSVQVLARRPKS